MQKPKKDWVVYTEVAMDPLLLTKIPSHFSSAVLRIGKSVFEERIDLPRIAAVHIGLFEENELIRHARIEVPLAKT